MFERIRTIKGRRYRYAETRWRAAGRVKSKSTYLGPVEGFDRSVSGHASEVEDTMQGYAMQESQKAVGAAPTASDSALGASVGASEGPSEAETEGCDGDADGGE